MNGAGLNSHTSGAEPGSRPHYAENDLAPTGSDWTTW